MITAPREYRRRPRRHQVHRAITMVETVIAAAFVALAMTAALSAVAGAAMTQRTVSNLQRGQTLADRLMAEILMAEYGEPDNQAAFGLDTGESASSRANFDDVDDYHGWSATPPQNQDGTPIAEAAGWQESVTVALMVTMVQDDGFSLHQIKVITVQVKRDNVTVERTALRTPYWQGATYGK